MVLQLRISEQAEAALREQARRAGMDVEAFASRQLERAVKPRTLDEILGPREPSPADAMTEDEVAGFVQGEIDAARTERRAKQG